MEPTLITKADAAQVLKVSLSTVDRLIRDGLLRTHKYGNLPQSPVRVELEQVKDVAKARPPAARRPGSHVRRRTGKGAAG